MNGQFLSMKKADSDGKKAGDDKKSDKVVALSPAAAGAAGQVSAAGVVYSNGPVKGVQWVLAGVPQEMAQYVEYNAMDPAKYA